jgi:hypothetical protein
LVVADTTDVVMGNAADVPPAFTWTLAGTWPLALELDKLMVTPPAGAGPLSVTVAVDFLLPTTEAGARLTARSDSGRGFTRMLVLLLTPPLVAVIVPTVFVTTAEVVMVNVTDEAPAGTFTKLGI